MKKTGLIAAIILLVGVLFIPCSDALAASDGFYFMTEVTSIWDGTDGSSLNSPTADYDYVYGDDESVSYTLPWSFSFYGQSFNQITPDTNGNIWFSSTDAAYAVNLANTGRGSVITAWNNDLSSSFHGGVFIQHKTSPERVVIEWQAETYTEQGLDSPNTFAVVLYPDGTIRFDYKTFTTQNASDAGSGISRGDGSALTDLTSQFGSVFALAGRSFQLAPKPLVTLTVAKDGMGVGTITSTPSGISCGTTCSGNFRQGENVILTAAAGFGSNFGTWSEACNGTNPCSLTVDSAKSVTATFTETYAPAVVISSPSGTLANMRPVLNFTVSTGTVVVKVDGIAVNKISGDMLDVLTDGPHVVSVEATNAAGHLGFAESSFTVDTTPPAVASIIPATGSSNVPVRMSVLVNFAEQIDPASVTANTALLVSQGIPVPGDIRLAGDGKSFIFKPQGKLNYAATYTFTLKAGVRDLLGNTLNSDQTTTFSTPMVDPDLVGYWPMDGDWNDYSGFGNNGTGYGSSAFSDGRVPGVSSASFVIDSRIFEGSGGFVPTTPQFVDGVANSFSMSFWAKPTATRESTMETNGNYLLGDGVQRFAIAPVNMYNLGYYGATAGVSVGTNGISVFEETTLAGGNIFIGYMPSLLVYDSPTPLTGWNHIVVVYNNKQPSLYLNGVLVRTGQTSQQSDIYPAADFAFGNERATGAYSGQLEGVVYHDRALTAQEIQALYQNQNQAVPQITMTSPGQTVKYKPGETGSATISVTSTTGITKLYCSASGATTDGGLAINFELPQTQTTQQLNFHIAADAIPYASIVLSCSAQTANGVLGAGEVKLQSADLVLPTVISSTPANNAIDVSATMPITIVFSEAMDPESIVSHDTFKFQRTDNGAWVTGMLYKSPDGMSIKLFPSPALDSGTSYTITLSGVRDLAGNNLASDYALHFTTLQQTSLAITNQGTSSAPYVLQTGRYGTLALNNSYVSVSGGVTVDTLTMDHSTLNANSSAAVPGNLSVAYGNMVVNNSSQVNVDGTLNLAANLSLANSTMTVTGTGTVSGNVALNNSALTIKSSLQATGDVFLQNNSLLTHTASTTAETGKVDVTAATMTIDATSKVDVSGKGYLGGFQSGNGVPTGRTLGNTTTGGSTGLSGGSYAGIGGESSKANAAYGDMANPSELGSGGSGYIYEPSVLNTYYLPGNNGGGLIRLNIGTLSLDGVIAADGATADIGGGSGGGIRIDAGRIIGNGRISATGGTSVGSLVVSGGGGGGGRIAVYYGSLALPMENIVVSGGLGLHNTAGDNGGAGTIYLKNSARSKPDLIISNGSTISTNLTTVPGGNYGYVDIAAKTNVVVNGDYSAEFDLILNDVQMTVNGALNLPATNVSLVNSSLTVNGPFNVPGNVVLNYSTLTVSVIAPITMNSLTLRNNSVLTHSIVGTTTATYKLDVTANTIDIDTSSKIDVSGLGYLAGYQGSNSGSNTGRTNGNVTTGGSNDRNGGSYGGLGGYYNSGSVVATYGSLQLPNELGSGGGGAIGTWPINYVCPGGNGGGFVKLSSGNIILNGSILADGASVSNDSSCGGAGSGGGILINVGTLSGTGTINARGGAFTLSTSTGSGGGGRIAVYYTVNTLPTANISAFGGKSGNGSNSTTNGGAGTIYLKDSVKTKGDVVVNNGGVTTNNATSIAGGDYGSVQVMGGANTSVAGNINFERDVVITGSNLTINGGITASGNLTLDGSSITTNGAVNVVGILTLKNNSVLLPYATTTASTYKLDITAGSISIDNSSKFDVSSRGYLGGRQPGNSSDNGRTYGNTITGGSSANNGGSYGGLGGNAGGTVNAVYGNILQPNEVGSGGGGIAGPYSTYIGGNGGGQVKLTTGSLSLNGSISADGGVGVSSGGGSGGAVLLNIGTLSGTGMISAKGGVGSYGGGGGGKIALYYTTNMLPLANISAAGGKVGSGTNPISNGGAGTIYLKDSAKANGDVVVNNGGVTTSNVTSIAGGDYGFVQVAGGAKITIAGDIRFDRDVVFTGSNMTINGGITTTGNLTLDGSNITINGPVNVTNALTLKNGSVLNHSPATTTAQYKLDVTAGSISIDSTSKIDVSSSGYLGGRQPGNSNDSGRTYGNTITGGSSSNNGGSYGGLGGNAGGTVNAVYGSILQPNEVGSGGGGIAGYTTYIGGNGGGQVKLTAGSLSLSGSILADGGVGVSSGGGSGGAIVLNVGTLSGTGIISAKGGVGSYGGGGGGRIALYYTTNMLPLANILATGGKVGSGTNPISNGGAGTIYLKDSAKAKGDLFVNNGGIACSAKTPVSGDFDQINVIGGAVIKGSYVQNDETIYNNVQLSLTDLINIPGSLKLISSTLSVSGNITIPGNLTLDGSCITANGLVNVASNLTLKNSSVLSHSVATTTAQYKLEISAGSVDVDATSKIDVSSKGYLGCWQGGNNTGTGRTYTTTSGSTFYSGGSYSGLGGKPYSGNVNGTYGSISLPGDVGSGGGGPNEAGNPGGNGGGQVKLTTGTLNLNGNIVADGGASSYAGGGSGGSILLDVGTISGSGMLYARGGTSSSYGAGGGGRIAIYYDTNTLSVSNISAVGGKSSDGSVSANNGGAGTVYLKDKIKLNPDVIINNNNVVTTNSTSIPGRSYGLVDVKNGAVLVITGSITTDRDMLVAVSQITIAGGITSSKSLTLDNSSISVAGAINLTENLTLKNSSTLSHYGATLTSQYKLDATAASISIDATSKIDVSSKGYLGCWQGGNNTGTGRTSATTSGSTYYSGGSFGGLGGKPYSGNVNATYGSISLPGDVGSGGGGPNEAGNPGGNGGGQVKLTTGTLSLNGNIVADGGASSYAGGGSGGSILLDVGTISGSGILYARGGTSSGYGAGGGGRIAIFYNTNTLPAGNLLVTGGKSGDGSNSVTNGKIGTVYLFQNVFPLTVTKAGIGNGTAQSTPSGITCGATCSGNFPKTSGVTLTATSAIGSIFSGWSGSCSGTGSCSVTMDAAKNITATFIPAPPPTVTITSPVTITKNNRPLLQYSVSAGTVVVKVDGVVVSKVTGNTLDLLSDGTHTIRVEATNNGVTGYAENTVIIDTIAPSVTVTALPAVVKAATQTLTGTVEAGSNVSVSVTTGTASLGTVTYPTGTTWRCDINNLTVGMNAFIIVAHDQAGNTSQVSTSVTYALPVSLTLSAPTIAANFKGTVALTVSHIDPVGSEILVEQFVDANNNGVIDTGDYPIRSFKVADGISASYPHIPGDEDLASNGTTATTLNFALTSDITHAPGSYLFRVTSGSDTTTAPFTINPVAQMQFVAGSVTDGTNPVPGAIIRLFDKWQRPVAWAIADASGNYTLDVPAPGEYRIIPIAYGFVADPAGSPVTLTAGQNIPGHTLTLTPGTLHLSGTVKKDQAADPVAGAWVQAAGGNSLGYAITAANGSYDLKLPVGQYNVTVVADATLPNPAAKGYLAATRQPQHVNLQVDTSNVDISLLPVSITVTGTVMDQYGTPLSGLPILGKLAAAADAREPVSFATTDVNGNYALNLSAGTQWTISLDDSVDQHLGYFGSRISNFSTAGMLTGNNITVRPVTSWIQGTVRDSNANLLGNIDVQLRNSDSSGITHISTAADGTYRFGVFGGDWFVNAFFEHNGQRSVGEQTATVTDGQTATLDFVVDVVPPAVTITSPTASTTPDNTPVLTYTVNKGTVVVKVDGAVINKVSGDSLDALANGPHTLVVESTDTAGNVSNSSVTFTVNYSPLALSTTAPADGIVDIAYNQTLAVSGGVPPYSFNLIDGTALPSGLILNSNTGVISGTPSVITSADTFRVQVVDSDGAAAQQYTMTIYSQP
jgi:hypothetical protein